MLGLLYAHKQLSMHLRDYVHQTELSVCFTQIIARIVSSCTCS